MLKIICITCNEKRDVKMQNDNTTIGGMDEDFLKAFKYNGNLNIITEYLRDKSKKLTFRYSSQNKNVFLMFYNKSLFWKIRRLKVNGKVQYKITFNFNHARYMPNWRSVLKTLLILGWEKEHIKLIINKDITPVSLSVGEISYIFYDAIESFFDKSYMVMREIMDCYQLRADANAHDYFAIDNVGDLLALVDDAKVKVLKGKV